MRTSTLTGTSIRPPSQPPGKRMKAVSTAEYRGVSILETGAGCTVVLAGQEFPCESLDEAVALIDAAYARVVIDPRVVAETNQH